MYCSKCGNNLEENAKFCQKCGTSVSVPNMSASQQPVNVAPTTQQAAYGTILTTTTMPKKNNIILIALGVAVAVLAIMLISMQSEKSSLETQNSNLERQMYDYENRNKIDKTIDAIDSWID